MSVRKTSRANFYISRAFVEDPAVFSRYAPLAERALCMSYCLDTITDRQRDVLKARLCGSRHTQIVCSGMRSFTTVHREEEAAFEVIATEDLSLISRLRWLMRQPFTKGTLEERRKEYYKRYDRRHSDRHNAASRRYCELHLDKRKATAHNHYVKEKDDLLQKSRERYAENRTSILSRMSERRKARRKERAECEQFVRMLNSLDPSTVETALISLGVRKYLPALDRICSLMRHPTPFIRKEAVWAIGEYQQKGCAPELISLAETADNRDDQPMLAEIVSALGKIGGELARDAVKRYCSHKRELIRMQAGSAPKRFGDSAEWKDPKKGDESAGA